MEDSKRKKKNKKNKGKAASGGGSPQTGPDLQTGQDEKLDIVPEQNHREPDTFTAQSLSVSESEGDLARLKVEESKVVSLEKKIEILQDENDVLGKREIIWNLKLEELQREMNSWSAKEASFDERIKSIENEVQSRVLEKSVSDLIIRLEEIDMGLQRQVRESEMTNINLIEENRALTNKVSLLEARVQHLEDKSAEYATSDGISVPAASSPLLLPEKEMSELPSESPSLGPIFETVNIDSAEELRPADGFMQHSEIVQIPLDDDDHVSDEEYQGQPQSPLTGEVKVNDAQPVPLSDAPLIGAPFRLISFFAQYVSGADLVRESSLN